VETRTSNGGAPLVGSPPELSFAVESVKADRFAVAPTLSFRLAIERVGGGPVRSIALNTQIRIAATRRSYDQHERDRLVEVFGPPEQWGRSVHSLPWTNATVHVPAFSDSTTVELPIVCTYDMEVTSAKYFTSLHEGEVPLELLFSGTVFYAEADGQLRVSHVPWEKEAEHRLPVAVWKEMMDRHFPGSAWLRLRRDSFDRLHAYKAQAGHMSFDDAIDELLRAAPGRV
jgi:hypothetical protein